MKKFVITLLLFMFTNSIFVDAFASSNTKNILGLKVDASTVENLHNASKSFEKTYNDFCKERKTEYPCKDGFAGTFSNSKKIATIKYTDKTAEDFFTTIAGFYSELTKFKELSSSIYSKEKEDIIANILIQKAKMTSKFSELVKNMNEERKILGEVEKKENISNDKLDEKTKSLKKIDANKYDKDLKKYENKGVLIHSVNADINLPEIPDDLSNADSDKLNEWKKTLDDLDQKIEKENTKTLDNIDKLKQIQGDKAKAEKAEKEKKLEDAWNALKNALENEKNAVNDYFENKKDNNNYKKDGDIISVKDMIKNINDVKKKIPALDQHVGNSLNKTEISKKNVPEDETEFESFINYLKDEATKANNNAEKLKKAKSDDEKDEVEKLKAELLKKKQKEAELIENITKDKTVVNDFNGSVDELNNSLKKIPETQDDKNLKVPDEKDNKKQIENLKKEIANVDSINKKLQKVIDDKKADEDAKLKECEKELQKLINPAALSTLDNPKVDSLKHCLEQLEKKEKEQSDQIAKIKNLFDDLKKIIEKITEREIKIFDRPDVMTNYVAAGNSSIKLERHDGVSENMKSYQSLGYSNDGNDRKISFKKDIGDKCNPMVKGLGVLTYNDMDTKPIKELEKWFTYIEKLIEIGNNNISIMDRFIFQETNICSINHNSVKLETREDGYKLYDAVEECLLQAEIKECEKYGKYEGLKLENFTKLGVVAVRESCYVNNFKNKCSVKDKYKWPVFTKDLTYNDMKVELDKCNDFENKTACEDHIKGLVNKINEGSNKKVNLQKYITPDLKYPECLNSDITKQICADYRDVNGLNKSIFGVNFNYGKGVTNCKQFVDTIITMFNNCPALKGRDISEFTTAEAVIAECSKIQSSQCNDYLAGAQKIKTISSDGINVNQPIDKCKPHVEETLCKNYSMKNIGYIPEIIAKSGSDTYDYLKECVAAVDKMVIKKDIEKVIKECSPKFDDAERDKLLREVKTVEDAKDRCLAHQIQKAVDRCNSNGKIIDNYSIKERNYTSVAQVEKVCFDNLKNKCPNSGFNWGVLSLDDMRTAYDKLKACQESQRDVLKKYLSDNFANVCSVYKASAGVKYVSTGSKGTVYNDSGNSIVYIVENKAKTAINNDLSSMKTYAEKVTDYCNSNGENFDIAGSCYEQKFYDKDSNRTTTLKSDARDTVEKIMYNMVNVVCGRDVWLNISSKTKTAKNYKVKLCKYAAVIKNNCQ